jgi:electron transport complex protein RnfG
MNEIAKMLIVLSVISGVCGFLLAGVRMGTMERIEEQVLVNVQGPAVIKAIDGSTNDLLKDRKKIKINGKEIIVFIGKKGNKPWAYAFETSGRGFGGDIGVITGFYLDSASVTGIGITGCKETPGLGIRVKDKLFTDAFSNRNFKTDFNIDKDGGAIDGVTGATVSSRGVCEAVRKAINMSKDVRAKL